MYKLNLPQNVLALNVFIVLVVALILVILVIVIKKNNKNKRNRTLLKIVLLLISITLISFVYIFLITPFNNYVVISETIDVNLPFYAKEKIDKEDIINAYIVDINSEKNYRPKSKNHGIEVWDYKVGNFILMNGKKAILMTSTSTVVCVETKEQYFLLAPTDFEEFIEDIEILLKYKIK